jgi:hypothetical protein
MFLRKEQSLFFRVRKIKYEEGDYEELIKKTYGRVEV